MLILLHNHVFDPRVKNIKYHFYYENFDCLTRTAFGNSVRTLLRTHRKRETSHES